MTALSPAARPRIALIDIARGVAIVAMVIYHFTWDLRLFEYIALDPTQALGWIIFQKAIVGSFIVLTGVSLVLAHGEAIRWPAFWRRFAILAGAALIVSIGTYLFSPTTFVFFGVLHAIAAFSLLGLAFLRLPLWMPLVLGIAVIALTLAIHEPFFSGKALAWIGLWDKPPPTEDLVPFFPWFGVTLLGIAAARWALASGFAAWLAAFEGKDLVSKILARMGRWSLVIYLVHQPILIGIFYLVTAVTGPPTAVRTADFLGSCRATCEQSSGDAEYCRAYCGCALDKVAEQDLWSMLEAQQRTLDEEQTLVGITNQCTADVLDERLFGAPQE